MEFAHFVHRFIIFDGEELDRVVLSDDLTLNPFLLQQFYTDESTLLLQKFVVWVGGVQINRIVELKLLDIDSTLFFDFLVFGKGDAKLEQLFGNIDLFVRE